MTPFLALETVQNVKRLAGSEWGGGDGWAGDSGVPND